MATILVHIALVAYAAAAAAFLTWLVRPQTRLARAGRALLAIGVVVHFAAFGVSLGVAGAGLGVPAWKGGQLFRLPSLDLLDRAGYRLAVWGFVFLSLAIATGSLVSREATGLTFPIAPKQGFAVLAWALFASMIQARLVAGWRGRRVAMLVVAGFVLL